MELATALAGLTLVTVNPSYAARELRYVLEQSRAEAVYFVPSVRGTALAPIVDAACADLPSVWHRILLTDHVALFAGDEAGTLRETEPDDIIQIQYTSGTTGFPKGALLHQKGLIQNGFDTVFRWGIEPATGCCHHAAVPHRRLPCRCLGGLANGVTLMLAPGFDPEPNARHRARAPRISARRADHDRRPDRRG